jgi:hypothetical protein
MLLASSSESFHTFVWGGERGRREGGERGERGGREGGERGERKGRERGKKGVRIGGEEKRRGERREEGGGRRELQNNINIIADLNNRLRFEYTLHK